MNTTVKNILISVAVGIVLGMILGLLMPGSNATIGVGTAIAVTYIYLSNLK